MFLADLSCRTKFTNKKLEIKDNNHMKLKSYCTFKIFEIIERNNLNNKIRNVLINFKTVLFETIYENR